MKFRKNNLFYATARDTIQHTRAREIIKNSLIVYFCDSAAPTTATPNHAKELLSRREDLFADEGIELSTHTHTHDHREIPSHVVVVVIVGGGFVISCVEGLVKAN